MNCILLKPATKIFTYYHWILKWNFTHKMWSWNIYKDGDGAFYYLNGWSIYDLNGWGIYDLNRCGNYDPAFWLAHGAKVRGTTFVADKQFVKFHKKINSVDWSVVTTPISDHQFISLPDCCWRVHSQELVSKMAASTTSTEILAVE